MVKTVTHSSGKSFKLGRKRSAARAPRLSLRNYLKISLPLPPTSVDYSSLAKKTLGNVYGNDQLGDCVIAGMAHVAGVLTANASSELPLTQQQIISLYSAIGNYVPGDSSTDNGCVEIDALNYWERVGLGNGHRISGYLAVNPKDPLEVRLAIYLFENLIYGVELPDDWISPMPSGDNFIWDSAGPANPQNGHCFIACGYDSKGPKIDTWGMLGTITDRATSLYASNDNGGELYTALSIDLVKRSNLRAPSGFNWSQLVADFDSIGHGKIM